MSAVCSAPTWNGVQFAGWVITTRSGERPVCSVTVRSTQRAISAVSLSAWYGVPASIIGTGSPTRRLNSLAMPSGWPAPRRAAGAPNSISSPDANTTDGTATS